jgi:cytoskeletal protein CcmA (bactofilin family)
MAIGRISGPLLKDNLLRDEVNLAFETNLLYLDVNTHDADVTTTPLDPTTWTGRIGIHNTNPAYQLDVTGTIRGTILRGGQLLIDDIDINNNQISSTVGNLVITAATGSDRVQIGAAQIPNIYGDVRIEGNLHATGNITADGSLQLGDAGTDNVVFAADIDSNFMPDKTDTYVLGGTAQRWKRITVQDAEIGDVFISGNTVTSATTNGDLNLNGNGSGDVIINGSVFVGPSSVTLDAPQILIGNILISGQDQDATSISTVSSNTDLTISASGTGDVIINSDTNITEALSVDGSTTLYGALSLQNDAVITGSLSVSGNFDIVGEITGDALQTDNIRITGNNISTTLSNSDLELNTSGSGTVLINGNDLLNYDATTWYVSEDAGSDSNDGRRPWTPFASLKYALTQVSSGDTILLAPGTYTEVFPLTVPQGVTVRGAGLRSTKIVPTVGTNDLDCFLLNGETTVEELTVADMFYDSINDTGYAFRFAPGTVVNSRSPYVQRVTVLNKGSAPTVSDPYGYLTGDAGRGAYLDGSQVSRSSLEAAILFNECTFIVPNSRALIMTNGARTEWLNCFTYFADLAVEGIAGTTGRGGDGKTRITFGGVSGSGFQVGETVRVTSTDASTVIDITVDSVSGSTILVDGKFDALEGEDLTPFSIVGLTSGTTATNITRYDRSEFAAELRAISGANVYGNQGVKADGDDVVIQLMAHNFAYIGTQADLTNNKSAVIQANEVIEVNGGRVYYNSVDQVGNFRVGDLFTVNFETGAVTFTGPSFDVTNLTGITFTDGTNVTVVNPSGISTGNLVLAGNTLSSTTGGITIDPSGSEQINLNGNTNVAGNLSVGGNISLTGNISIGDTQLDTITIQADFTSNLEPDVSNTYDLGTSNKTWRTVYAEQFDTGNIVIEDNNISTTESNSDLVLGASGTGSITVPNNNVSFSQNLDVDGATTLDQTTIDGTLIVNNDAVVNGDLTVTGTFNHTGDINVTENITVAGEATVGALQTDDIRVDGNVITTTLSNSDLELRTNGSGSIELQDNTNVTGTLDVSGQTTLSSANVEDLTAGRVVLAGVNGELEDSANLTFDGSLLTVTGNQRITGNLDVDGDITLGGNIRIGDQELDTVTVQADFTSDLLPNASNLYDLGNSSKEWRSISVGQIDVDSFRIDTNVISTKDSNTDIELKPAGTGTVVINSDQALQIPSGSNTVRPAGITGQIRFNTTTNQFEGYNSIAWSSLGGVRDVDGNTFIIPELTPGSNENTLYFYTDGELSATLDKNRLDVRQLTVDDIRIDGNVIETTASNSVLELRANGTGYVSFTDTNAIKLPVGTTAEQGSGVTGQVRFNTDTTQFEGYNGTAWSSLGGVRDVDGNTYIIPELSSGSNENTLYFYTDGFLTATFDKDYNKFFAKGLQIPTGGDADRPGSAVSGSIRFNTDTTQFEGYNGTAWSSLGGVRDVDGNTYIVPELSSGSNENTLYFYADGELSATLDKNTLNIFDQTFQNDQIRINDNRIETYNSNTDLILGASGSGVVYLDGTGAVRIPAGTTAERPGGGSLGDAGWIRYNTSNNSLEAWNGVTYQSVGGGSSSDANGDTLITFETLGNNEDIIRFYTGSVAFPGSFVSTGSVEQMTLSSEGLVINNTIRIQNNVIENINSDEDLILRASGAGRVILDGAGGPGDTGNVFATDPLLTLNSAQTSANGYDSGLIIERGSDINTGFIWDESADEFAAIRTIEQGTVRGNVAIAGYENVAVASVKLTSETSGKITFTDTDKIVRTLDVGRTAEVDGVMKFNTTAELAIPAGTTAQRPASPQTASVRYNSDLDYFEGYAGGSWQGLGVGFGTAPSYQGIIADGTDFEFTLDLAPLSAAGIIVAINGVVQEPEYAYEVEDNILRFIDESSTVVVPDAGDRIDIRFLSKPAISSVRERSFIGDGSTRSFAMSLPIASKPEVLVFVNNIYQDVAVYSVSGKNVIFDQAPQSDDRINIVHIAGIVAPNVATIQEADDAAIAFAIALG